MVNTKIIRKFYLQKTSENVSFICNENGGHILQDRCGQHCYEFDETVSS